MIELSIERVDQILHQETPKKEELATILRGIYTRYMCLYEKYFADIDALNDDTIAIFTWIFPRISAGNSKRLTTSTMPNCWGLTGIEPSVIAMLIFVPKTRPKIKARNALKRSFQSKF